MGAPEPRPAGGYRESVYPVYASHVQGAGERVDAASARRWGRAYDHYFRGWLPDSKDASIADLACGNGSLLRYFLDRGYSKLAGVDLSAQQVQLARQIVPGVECGDARAWLENRKGAFDLLTGLDLLEHLGKDEVLPFLEACRQALRPGGRVIFQTPNGDSPFAGSLRYGDFTHETCYTPKSLASLLRIAGFKEAEFREVGPVPFGYSLASSVRSLLWVGLRLGVKLWNRIETGSSGSGVCTRNLVASAKA